MGKTMKQRCCLVIVTLFSSLLATSAYQYQCGNQVDFARVCEDGNCCSTDGFCGTGDQYCSVELCQSQCPDPTEDPHDVSAFITAAVFDTLIPNRNDIRCPGHGFYTYESFLEAARRFPEFGTTGSYENRRRELAAFFGQTSALTGEGWPGADNGGEFAWGYCFVDLNYTGSYCIEGVHGNWPCVEGKSYRPRGPIQLTYNYNYGPAGKYLGYDLLDDPDLVAENRTISFETAIWFWMTRRETKPSCHEVMVGEWIPDDEDKEANRWPGYGVTTNILNGAEECGHGGPVEVITEKRVKYFNRSCIILGVSMGENLDCYNQKPFDPYSLAHLMMKKKKEKFPRNGLLRMPVNQA